MVKDRKCFICNKIGHIAKDCKHKPAPLKAILDAGPSSQRSAVMCVQLARPRLGQLVDHLRPVEPRRSNGNRFQPLTLANAGFWESTAASSLGDSARSIALSASDFPPLSAHFACAPRASLVQGEIDRIDTKISLDNFPPVGDGGFPQPRVNLAPILKTHSDNIPGSKIEKAWLFDLLKKSLVEQVGFNAFFLRVFRA